MTTIFLVSTYCRKNLILCPGHLLKNLKLFGFSEFTIKWFVVSKQCFFNIYFNGQFINTMDQISDMSELKANNMTLEVWIGRMKKKAIFDK